MFSRQTLTIFDDWVSNLTLNNEVSKSMIGGTLYIDFAEALILMIDAVWWKKKAILNPEILACTFEEFFIGYNIRKQKFILRFRFIIGAWKWNNFGIEVVLLTIFFTTDFKKVIISLLSGLTTPKNRGGLKKSVVKMERTSTHSVRSFSRVLANISANLKKFFFIKCYKDVYNSMFIS